MAGFLDEAALAKHIGQFLKSELKKNGITQESFAYSIGANPRTVRHWIGDGVHTLGTALTIAAYFGVDIRDIFPNEEDAPSHFFCKKTVYTDITAWYNIFTSNRAAEETP